MWLKIKQCWKKMYAYTWWKIKFKICLRFFSVGWRREWTDLTWTSVSKKVFHHSLVTYWKCFGWWVWKLRHNFYENDGVICTFWSSEYRKSILKNTKSTGTQASWKNCQLIQDEILLFPQQSLNFNLLFEVEKNLSTWLILCWKRSLKIKNVNFFLPFMHSKLQNICWKFDWNKEGRYFFLKLGFKN